MVKLLLLATINRFGYTGIAFLLHWFLALRLVCGRLRAGIGALRRCGFAGIVAWQSLATLWQILRVVEVRPVAGILDLRFLGTVRVSRDGRPVEGLRSRKALALLGYLSVQRQPIPRDQLVALFWNHTRRSEDGPALVGY